MALVLAAPIAQTGLSVVNIAYGNSWPRSIVVDSGRQLVFVDGESGIYPPDGFSFGVLTTSNETMGKVIGLPEVPGELALDATSDTVYSAGQNTVSVIDGKSMTLERTLALKIPIFSIAFDGSSDNLLVTSGNRVFELDPVSGVLLRNATVGEAAEGMAVDPASGVVFVASYLSSSVSVLRTSDLAVVKTVELPSPSYPSQLSLDAKRAVLYVTTGEQSVVEVSSTKYSVVGSVRVSQSSVNGTYALAVDPQRNRLFVATEPGTTISELNETTGALLSAFTFHSAVYEMAVDQTTGKLYVTNYHQVSVVSPVDVLAASPQPLQYLPLAVLAVGAIVVALYLVVRSFTASDGRRDGSARQRQRGRSLWPSFRRQLPAGPLR